MSGWAHQVLGVVGEKLLRVLVVNTGMDDDIVALLPVYGGGDLVLVAQLQGVDNAENLVKVATSLGLEDE